MVSDYFAIPVTSIEINFDDLPSGTLALGVTSTDGFHTAKAQSSFFQLPLKCYIPMIYSPSDGAKFRIGEHILLQCCGYYSEDETMENKWLFWSDDTEGKLVLVLNSM